MTPRQLKYFLRIAELGSFTKAAAVLHIAQPALSRQMQQLEGELGVQIFVRSDTGVTLTEAGQALTGRAGKLLEHFASVQDEVSALSGVVQGRLQFGAPPSLAELVIIPLLLQFRSQHPAVTLSYVEGTSSTVYEMLLQGRLDMGVVLSAESMQGLQHRPLFGEQLVLAGAPGDFASAAAATLQDVAKRPLLLTPRTNTLRIAIEEALQTAGLPWTCVLETNSVQAQKALAAAGAGFTLLPASAVAPDILAGRLSGAPVDGLQVRWTLVHAKDRALGTAAQRLVELLLAQAAECHASGRWPGFLPG